ncbi:MAG: ZIP family metal transporter [Flavobacteriales bacterium]|nr:ZIP family metal transporter [Flavobacteriales bacterium]MCX7769257.1 ZIP family metal transporter [Flavobacteriales bacterium]MDW8410002.1 ZIP family metal transporter [Flavobacteriales bacterium]
MWHRLVEWLEGQNPVLGALMATLFTWGVTASGAAFVFFIRDLKRMWLDAMLGFTGGVMVAASFWSLLSPAIQMSKGDGFARVLPALSGFLAGGAFIFILDKLLPHLHINFPQSEGLRSSWQSTTLLVLAITLHNIPEGLAIGVMFGGVAAGMPDATIPAALTLAIGIGLQNFPEGVAVAIPLRRMGLSRRRSFLFGQMSAVVEPLAGVAGAVAVHLFSPILPYALAFAAGAMIFVVVEEVIPETQLDEHTDLATLGFMAGFAVMMTLDVALS